MVNSNWGGVVEDNSFGTHEFMDLCEQIGCEPYLAVNMGSGTVAEAADWVEYLTADGESDMAKLRAKERTQRTMEDQISWHWEMKTGLWWQYVSRLLCQ